MSNKRSSVFIPVTVIIIGFALIALIVFSKPPQSEKKDVDTRPIVKVSPAKPEQHQVRIKGYGELRPLERTVVSAQVSGEVIKWNPNFVEGGLVKRGEVLFEVEPDNYEVALLQAQSQLQSAKAALVEEQGRAEVAKREAKTMPNERVSDLYLRKPQVMSAEAAVKLAEASVKLAERDLANCRVVAPYDALVVRRELGTGQFVSTGMNVGELYNVERAEVVFPIAGFDRSFLPVNLKGKDALISTQDKYSVNRSAQIVRDTGIIDQQTRMGHVVVELEDPYGLQRDLPRILFGSYVEVSFDGLMLNDVVKLSQDLVTNNRVWVLNDDKTIKQKVVDVVKEEGKDFLIGDGLEQGDNIVMTIPEFPQEGMEVRLEGDKKKEKTEKNKTSETVNAVLTESTEG